MTTIGNIGLGPLPEAATKGGTGKGSDAPAGKDAFHSILAHIGHATARSSEAIKGVVADDDNDGAADKGRAVAKAVHAAKDRPRQKTLAEPLPSEPSDSVVPMAVADPVAIESSTTALVAPTPGAPDLKLAVPASEPDAKAAHAEKLRRASAAKSETPQGSTRREAPSVLRPAEQPSSPAASDPIALRITGTVPVGWRQGTDGDAPVPADKVIERGAASTPTMVVQASITATETHAGPVAPSQLSPAAIKAQLPAAGDDDDGEAAEDPGIQRGDRGAGVTATPRDKGRRVDDAHVVRAEPAPPNVTDRPAEPGAGLTQPAASADPTSLPHTVITSVVDAVVTTANRLGSASNAPGVAAPAALSQTSVGEVRTMTMRLDLPEHGGVNLRVSLKGNALSLNVTAERDDTARRLRRDRDALTSSLRDHGYETDIRSIDVGRPDAPSASRDPAGVRDQNSATTGSGSGQLGSDQRPTEPRQQERGGRPYRETDVPQETKHEKSKPDDSRGRGLYV